MLFRTQNQRKKLSENSKLVDRDRSKNQALGIFHPLIEKWFREQVGVPTDVQEKAWPTIAEEKHVLITAPTGSGKTLTSFLWALNQLVTGSWESEQTSVLYISPLKALNNDIRRNLLEPLNALRSVFEEAGEPFPDIQVKTRSGDTSQQERRQMIRRPPEILITTPESLNLLLSSKSGKTILLNLKTVILDEIHAIIGTKRGTHLITAVDRLIPLSDEFQRIALSATVRPMETVAEFIGGLRVLHQGESVTWQPRPVELIRSKITKKYDVVVEFPDEAINHGDDSLWDPLSVEFRKVVGRNRSTLFFVNSRKLSEKITGKINDNKKFPVAYAHHGSLSREIRAEVEKQLKAGNLKAIVATNSLEMGIDIGALDEVVLIQSPPSVSSAIQRVGRAGHRVGETSRGVFFPTHSQDFLEAAVLASGIMDQDIESITPVNCPLDVLAQVIVSMTGTEIWDIDQLFMRVRSSYPYRNLSRTQFDLVLNMLAGRYVDSRIRELQPRISIDRLDNTVTARKGALLVLYMSGGMIPNRGYYQLRHQESNARIGELDEEFVWEAYIGKIFHLGTQSWRIERITHNDVFVTPAKTKEMSPPFWKGEVMNRDFHFSEKIATFLEEANENLKDPRFFETLRRRNRMSENAADQLLDFLKRQRERTEVDLPHRHHILVEYTESGPGGSQGNQVVLHTFWGGRVNRPFAMALDAAWEEKYGERLEIFASNDCIAFLLPIEISAQELLSMVTAGNLETLLKKRLEGSGFFAARFRETAGIALLLTKNKMNQRMPLWMSRQKAQKLMESVLQYDDFPILLEAWRTCLQDEFDPENLKKLLSELESGVISWSYTKTGRPSPMAQNIAFDQINQYMYQLDESASEQKSSKLRDDLLQDVVFTPELRPTIDTNVIRQFVAKRQRLFPGYAPGDSRDLLDWVRERLLIPLSEWESLLEAIQRDTETDLPKLLEPIRYKLIQVCHQSSETTFIVSIELVEKVLRCFFEPSDLLVVDFASVLGKASGQSQSIDRIDIDAVLSLINRNQSIDSIHGIDEIMGKEVSVEEMSRIFNTIGEEEEEREEILSTLIGEWCRFYGPISVEFMERQLGIERSRLIAVVDDLLETRTLISGRLISGNQEELICDSENFEILLRLARLDSIPTFEPLESQYLQLFLANYQGIITPEEGIDSVFHTIEQLNGYHASASSWESEYLPARTLHYLTSWLDTIMQGGDLCWFGSEDKKISFSFRSDLDLFLEKEGADLSKLFPDEYSRYDFPTLQQMTGENASGLTKRLWEHVWNGEISNDSFITLRRAIENRFKIAETPKVPQPTYGRRGRSSGNRSRFSQWKSSVPFSGNWYPLPSIKSEENLLELEEKKRDRVRVLLERYGILFRELLKRESPALGWSSIFRTLRLMELSGELLSGCFFHGIPGPQFISHQAFRSLQRQLPENKVYWINATDPASLCGIALDAFRGTLPKRLIGNHLVFRGTELIAISESNGKRLTFNMDPDDKDVQNAFGFLRHLLERSFQPKKQITIETINGIEATKSPWLDQLRVGFDPLIDLKTVTLYKKRF